MVRWGCLVAVLTCCHMQVTGQSGKAFLKQAEALRKQQQFEEALEKYGLAIAVDDKLLKAFQGRAEVYGLLGMLPEAAADLKRTAELDPAEPAHAVAAAKAFLDLGALDDAQAMGEQALRVSSRHMDALQTLTRICLASGNLDCAAQHANAAITQKRTTDTHYLHGRVAFEQRDLLTAEKDFEQVLQWNHLYEEAYVALAETQLLLHDRYTAPAMRMRTLEKAIERTTTALELNPGSTDALFTRSKAFAEQKEYAKAIDDISKVVALGREEPRVFMQRARYYHGYGQHQNAVNDLNRVLLKDPDDIAALLLRAEAREANLDMEGALKDLELIQRRMEADETFSVEDRRRIETTRTRIADQVFEMNRESDPPYIAVITPHRMGDRVQVSSALANVQVSGYVRDRSLLKHILVNGQPADFDPKEKDPQFVVTVPLASNALRIEVEAMDIYGNSASSGFDVERTEGVPPGIEITSPAIAADQTVTITAGRDELFVEGRVRDASLIRLITVNGITASYAPDALDPEFSIKVDLKERDRFVVRAEDQYGNSAESLVHVVRKAPEPVATKPPAATPSTTTGITWVVFIENTTYKDFPSLNHTGAEVDKMRKAFANYSIQRTITKKNLSKEQLERFFNVELRDLVRKEKVNTILVWYAGHGRTVGGKAYWVPVDGRKDDIYSFYNFGALKAQMRNYSESVSNTLVVSDAAGSDPSFYELTR